MQPVESSIWSMIGVAIGIILRGGKALRHPKTVTRPISERVFTFTMHSSVASSSVGHARFAVPFGWTPITTITHSRLPFVGYAVSTTWPCTGTRLAANSPRPF